MKFPAVPSFCLNHKTHFQEQIVFLVSIFQKKADAKTIYFNGSWTDKFDKRETKVEPFRGYTRDIKRVNMMHRNDKYFFANSQDFDAIQIPYGDRSFQMMVLLPHEGKSIDDMMSTLTSAKLDQVRQSM